MDDGAFLHRVLFAVQDHDAVILQDDYFEAECLSKVVVGIAHVTAKQPMRLHWVIAFAAGVTIGADGPTIGRPVASGGTGAKPNPHALRQAAMNNAGNPDRGKALNGTMSVSSVCQSAPKP